MSVNRTEQYFDECYIDYNVNWSKEHLHLGLWYDETKSHDESLFNTIKESLNFLKLNNTDNVLDLGCGTGGSCRFMATAIKCHVTGITNSKVLYNNALEQTKHLQYSNYISYILADYLNSGFLSNSFHKILAIESICQTTDLLFLLNEIYRILKPGGRVVIVDFFLTGQHTAPVFNIMLSNWLEAWQMQNISFVKSCIDQMLSSNFINIEFHDKTNAVKKSCKMMADSISKFLPRIVAQYVHGNIAEMRVDNITAAVKMNEFLNQGLWQYGIIVADKPL